MKRLASIDKFCIQAAGMKTPNVILMCVYAYCSLIRGNDAMEQRYTKWIAVFGQLGVLSTLASLNVACFSETIEDDDDEMDTKNPFGQMFTRLQVNDETTCGGKKAQFALLYFTFAIVACLSTLRTLQGYMNAHFITFEPLAHHRATLMVTGMHIRLFLSFNW